MLLTLTAAVFSGTPERHVLAGEVRLSVKIACYARK
jgi:hypothetical protein